MDQMAGSTSSTYIRDNKILGQETFFISVESVAYTGKHTARRFLIIQRFSVEVSTPCVCQVKG